MFWIAFLGLSFSWMLIKLGFLSATVGILAFVVKLLLFVIVAGLIAVKPPRIPDPVRSRGWGIV
ncbi:MAG TPA: hypothetical protein PK347_18660, partial [Burkholderiaceae bacterium]|nr:hypothetical protein [Burkholderiaceae bacterium]